MSYGKHDRLTQQIEPQLFRQYPQLEQLLIDDVERQWLRVRVLCPRGHSIETVVLDADHNWHLYLLSLVEYERLDPQEGDRRTQHAVAATKWAEEDSVKVERIKLPCPKPRCKYNGTKTKTELLKLFFLARFVYDTAEMRLTD